MRVFLSRSLRSALALVKRALLSNRFGRNLLHDLNNRDEFTSLLAHEKMLADRIRVDSYYEAIRRAVKPDDVVVDLGTGTGILAMFAARQRPRKVYALDHSRFIEVARRIARHNGLDQIEFVATNSREFAPPEKVDLIIHEQIGDELFSENMVENLLDLKRRILKPGGRILPGDFALYVEPVQLARGREVPFIWEEPIHGLDFSFLEHDKVAAPYLSSDYDFTWIDPGAVDCLLGDAQPALRIDLNTIREEGQVPHEARVTRQVRRDGFLDGYVVYFRVNFEDTLNFDTSPLSALTHWRCRMFRVPRRRVRAGEHLDYVLDLSDLANAHRWRLRERPQTTAGMAWQPGMQSQ